MTFKSHHSHDKDNKVFAVSKQIGSLRFYDGNVVDNEIQRCLIQSETLNVYFASIYLYSTRPTIARVSESVVNRVSGFEFPAFQRAKDHCLKSTTVGTWYSQYRMIDSCQKLLREFQISKVISKWPIRSSGVVRHDNYASCYDSGWQ